MPRTTPRTPPRINLDPRPTQGHAARVQLDKATTARNRQLRPGIQHHFRTGFVVNFCAGFRGHGAAGLLMETAGDGLAAISADGDSAFTIGGAVVCRFYMVDRVALTRQVPVFLEDFGPVVSGQ